MRNEKGQEVNRGEELVVDTEPWVELRALVVNEPVLAILKSPKAHDGALHVGEEALEPGAILAQRRCRAVSHDILEFSVRKSARALRSPTSGVSIGGGSRPIELRWPGRTHDEARILNMTFGCLHFGIGLDGNDFQWTFLDGSKRRQTGEETSGILA
jgi:hypothetical protein